MFFSNIKCYMYIKELEDLSSGSGLPHVGCVTEAFPLLTPSNSDTSWVSYNSVLTLITRRLRFRGKGLSSKRLPSLQTPVTGTGFPGYSHFCPTDLATK